MIIKPQFHDKCQVIIATWNGDAVLKRCLDSLVRVYGNSPETIVVDNANCVTTKKLVEQFPFTTYMPSSNQKSTVTKPSFSKYSFPSSTPGCSHMFFITSRANAVEPIVVAKARKGMCRQSRSACLSEVYPGQNVPSCGHPRGTLAEGMIELTGNLRIRQNPRHDVRAVEVLSCLDGLRGERRG